jgi:hypothetical protein
MSLENVNAIDFVSVSPDSGDVTLTITDHLPWVGEDKEHVVLLQKKIERYLRAIESGEIYETFPKARHRTLRIEVVGKFPLTDFAKSFYDYAEPFAAEVGTTLNFREL